MISQRAFFVSGSEASGDEENHPSVVWIFGEVAGFQLGHADFVVRLVGAQDDSGFGSRHRKRIATGVLRDAFGGFRGGWQGDDLGLSGNSPGCAEKSGRGTVILRRRWRLLAGNEGASQGSREYRRE